MEKYDFSGWATRANIKCSDGRTIMEDAFKDNDGQIVPLVWNHQHNEPYNVLGHALLKNEKGGVRTYCWFNDSESGKNAKLLVDNGDITSLSIYANQLKQNGGDVLHGNIREVSLVLAGANPGAFIDSVMSHGELSDEEAIIYSGEDIAIYHSEEEPEEKSEEVLEEKVEEKEEMGEEALEHKDAEEMTIGEIFNTLTDEQKDAVYAIIGGVLEDMESEDEGEDEDMKHNVFDMDKENPENVLTHAEEEAIFNDVRRYGSLKESMLQHGITNIANLFPEDKLANNEPFMYTRNMEWVSKVMTGVHHTPFSRVKSTYANLTEDDARARGYLKGHLKKEEVFAALKRSVGPTTIYKKQKLDRDDVIDITDFDVVAWIKREMRMMLEEEIARAILVGDGRTVGTDDKIPETCIIPIAKDNAVYAIKATADAANPAAFIDNAVRQRKYYRGSGMPVLYTTEDMLTEMLLIKDLNQHRIYNTVADVAAAMRVSDIVTVPVMETSVDASGNAILGIIVNLRDYNVGADKGGEVEMFDDFDIDYNAQKYLIETRCSGALVRPYSAIVFTQATSAGGDGKDEGTT